MSLLSPSSESQSPNEMVLIPRIILPYPFKPQKLRGLQVAKSIVAILFAFLQNPLYFVPPHLWILHSRTEPVLHRKWYVEGVIKPSLETLISHTGVCDFEPWLCFSYNFLAIHTLGGSCNRSNTWVPATHVRTLDRSLSLRHLGSKLANRRYFSVCVSRDLSQL